MDTEFHYWATGLIAKHAGFSEEEAQVIAYSSQYVDDNDSEVNVFDEHIDSEPSYISQISQTMNILLPNNDLMKVYPIFHFIPGDQQDACPRLDGRKHPLNTTPDSSYARKIMQSSIKRAASKYMKGDLAALYGLGICTHAYADTWAHQNFVGHLTDFNAIGKNLIPDIGHADAMHSPDWVGYKWNDARLTSSEINNKLRFITAARRIYQWFQEFLRSVGKICVEQWQELESQLLKIFGQTYTGDRKQNYGKRMELFRQQAPYLEEYDAFKWINSAINTITYLDPYDNYIERYIWINTKEKTKTEWFKFQESVKEHLASTTEILKPALEEAKAYA